FSYCSVGPRDALSFLDYALPIYLALRLEPFHAAVIVLGEWTFGAQTTASAKGLFARAWRGLRRLASHQPEVVLTFPVLTYRTGRSEEHTSELQSREKLVCRLLLE